MAVTSADVKSKIATSNSASKLDVGSFFNYKYMKVMVGIILVYVVSARLYQGWAGWEYGTEATDPAFQTYWMNVLYVQLVVFASAFVISNVYLWTTRDQNLDKITPSEEVRRYLFFIGMLFCYALMVVFAGSLFAEEDASWHQVVMRDTSFTPSHVFLFYGTFPAYICLGVASYTYATTRLPLYAKGISLPLVVAVVGPMMIFPNVGYNEWGHAFWFMEEYFTAPLHWGFVIFGWAALALGGVLVGILSRLTTILPDAFEEESKKA